MGLNTLKMVLEKKGPEYVDKFLSEEVIITEKLDTYRILFEKINGEIKFFKKDNAEINLIERTLTDIWETALLEIPIIINSVNLPENIRFGVSYTPVERPNRIPYYKIPSYILTDVTKRDGNKVLEVFDYDEVSQWASILNMGRPPIIFKGTLSKEQKRILLAYETNQYDGLDESFSKMISKWIGNTYSGEDTIEGVIVNGKDQIAQIISYEFNLLNEAYKNFANEKNSKDIYDLVILSLNDYMDSYKFPVLEGDISETAYINIISDIFNGYYKTNKISESLEPKYLTPPYYGYVGELNKKFIKNEKTTEILKKGPIYESFFRIFLSSFRKFKKSHGLINEKSAEKFNTFVYMIKEYCSTNLITEQEEIEQIEESHENILNEARSENIVVKAFDKKKTSDIDNMRVIASIQKAFDPNELNIIKGSENCVVYITDLTPFTRDQMDNLYAINRSWKLPVVLGTVGNKKRVKGKKFFLSDSLLKAELDSISIFNKDIIPNYFMLESWDLKEIFEYVRPKYEPIALITDSGKKADFIIQLYFEDEVMGGRIGAEPEFNIGEMEINDKLKAFRTIEDELFSSFRDLTPQPIWGLYDSMKVEYKTWSGQLPNTLIKN